MATVTATVKAQTSPQAKPKLDTNKQDRMPVVKPQDNSTMPVVKPQDNSNMPIVKPVPDTAADRKRRATPKL